MEGAYRWGCKNNTTSDQSLDRVIPKPNSTLCCPSLVISTEPPSNKRMKKGSNPARAGVSISAVAPKGNCQPWWRDYSLSSTTIKRIPPLMSWARSLRWRGRKPTKTCISSRRFCMTPFGASRADAVSRVGDAGRIKAALQGVDRLLIDATERACHRCKMIRTISWFPEEKKQHTLKNTVMARPDKFIIFLGRTFSGHNHRLPVETRVAT